MKLVSEADRKAFMDVARVAQKARLTIEEFAALLIECEPLSMDDTRQKMRAVLNRIKEGR